MNIDQRIELMGRLGEYMTIDSDAWEAVKERAYRENGWFVPDFIGLAVNNIVQSFLDRNKLKEWTDFYQLSRVNTRPKLIGIVMAGNIPLVGFHDLLCCFISGNRALVKLSTRDDVMIRHLAGKLLEWEPEIADLVQFAERLNGCDAYIATGSNNTSRYFEYYFAKYPHIIRKNRTSVAILDGSETKDELSALAEDIMLFFGLGCRNITQLFVPTGYDFVPLLEALKKFGWAGDHNKYRNNYDYNLALHMLNSTYYMTNETTLLIEHASPFSPISQVNYQFYSELHPLLQNLQSSEDVQAVAGHYGIPFGKVQQPSLTEYADGTDTLQWLKSLETGITNTEINPAS